MIKLTNNSIDKILNKILFINYFIYQFFLVFSESVISSNVPLLHTLTVNTIRLSFVIVILINAFKVLTGKFNVKEIIVCTLIGIFFFYAYLRFKDGMMLLNLLYVCSFKDIDYKVVFKIFFISTIFAVLLVGILSIATGLTNNIDTYRMGVARTRYSLGFNSRPTAPYFLLSATMAIMIIIKQNVFKCALLLYLLNLAYFVLTLSRGSFLCLNIFFVLYFIVRKNNSIFNKVLLVGTGFAYIFMPILSYLISLYYDSENKIYSLLNDILSGRLYLTHNALVNRRIGLWGSTIIESLDSPGRAFIDSAFVHCIVFKGIIVFAVLIIIHLIYIYVLHRTKNYLIMLAVLIVAFMSTFDVGFAALQFSPFIIPFLYLFNKCKFNDA